jgi:hypothetical protein
MSDTTTPEPLKTTTWKKRACTHVVPRSTYEAHLRAVVAPGTRISREFVDRSYSVFDARIRLIATTTARMAGPHTTTTAIIDEARELVRLHDEAHH